MKSNYKPIGKHIRLVDERNKGLQVQQLLGLSISKQFIPSVANIIGTDMENYKIIRKNQFACSTMQVRRDKKMPVALLKDLDEAIISQAYPIFEVKNEKELLPEYLMMWFERAEFDREACFHAVGGVRGSLEWEDFESMQLPIPHPDKQRAIVKEYNTIQNRIALNQQLIQKLEETAHAIYREWFVEGIDLENLPEEWQISTLDDEFKITIGRTPPRIEEEWFSECEDSMDWISIKDMASCDSFIFNTNEKLTKEAVKRFSIPIIPENTTILSFKMSIGKLAITTKEMLSNEAIAHFVIKPKSRLTTEYIYCFLNYFKFNALGTTSSIVDSINTTMIKEIEILVPSKEKIQSFQNVISKVFSLKKNKENENEKLKELKALLLSKLATVE